MNLLILIALLVFTLVIHFKFRYYDKIFVIKVSPGKLRVKKGKPPSNFLKESKLLIRHQIVRGHIYGFIGDHGFKLTFSDSITNTQAQRFRNIFPFELYNVKNKPIDRFPGKKAKKAL